MKAAHTLVIGIGNEFRRDDAAGLLVVHALRAGPLRSRKDVELQEHHGEATALIESWSGRERVIVVDAAVQPNATPGTVVQFSERESSPPWDVELRTSSHALSVVQAVQLAREMKRLPKELRIYCIIGADFSRGTTPSDAVLGAIPIVALQIAAAIDS